MRVEPALLRTFLAVARAGSVTAAARTVHRSQPAVSAQIHKLEAALGDHLFRRGPRGVRLTPLGERLLPFAEALERVVVGVHELAEDVRGATGGHLDLAASTTIALYWLPERLVTFHRAHPGVTVRVLTRNSREAVEALVAGTVDVALVEGHAEAWAHLPQDVYRAHAVHDDQIVVVMAPGHPLAGRASLRPEELEGVDLVWREAGSGTRDVVERALRSADVRPVVRLELTEPEAMKRAVRSGVGVAFLSAVAVVEEVARGSLVAVPCDHPGFRRRFTLIAPAVELASRATRAFMATTPAGAGALG